MLRIFMLTLLIFSHCSADEFFENLNSPIHFSTEAYIVCNEKNQEEILEQLSIVPIPEKYVHIGWSIEFNYRIISLRKPEIAIICDRSQAVFDFYDKFKKNMLSIQYEQFLEKHPEYTWVTENDFNYIKQMYQEDRIHHVSLDLMDEEGRFDQISCWLINNNYVVDTIYVSNCLDWIARGDVYVHWSLRKPRDLSPYFNNLKKLINENTRFIHCTYHRGMKLKMEIGKTQ